MSIRTAIIYYSATGHTHHLAQAVAEGAQAVGAEVRLRHVTELAPEQAINQNPNWRAHRAESMAIPTASHDDLVWADAIILGTPTRFGAMASQLKQFIDTTGGLWAKGLLSNKVAASFVTTQNPHGGQEATLLSLNNVFYHWGAIIAPPGYTDPVVFPAGGNPYGASATEEPNPAELASARYLGQRVATVAQWIAAGRNPHSPT